MASTSKPARASRMKSVPEAPAQKASASTKKSSQPTKQTGQIVDTTGQGKGFFAWQPGMRDVKPTDK